MGCTQCYQTPQGEVEHRPQRPLAVQCLLDNKGRKPLKIRKGNFVVIRDGELQADYRLEGQIGQGEAHSGAHGAIFKATHLRLGQLRAVKTIDGTRLPPACQKQFLMEAQSLRDMVSSTQDHPNILKIYEVVREGRWYHIVTELLTGGELLDRIIGSSGCSEPQVAKYMRQILAAVSYCHRHNVIHRDLKPENLVFETPAEDSLLKVIDFGASCWITGEQRGLAGTDYYLAPEVLREEQYDEKCDVWSCGVIMYILFCGYPPFNGLADCAIHKRILHQDIDFPGSCYAAEEWKNVSRQAKSLIRQMLAKDPQRRPSAQSLLSHPWVNQSLSEPDPLTTSAEQLSALTRLRDYRASTKLRQATLHLISTQILTPEHFKDLRAIFLQLDKDQDGKLSQEEIRSGFPSLTESQKEMMVTVLSHTSEYIEFSEFLTATLSWSQVLDQATVEAAFQTLDSDRDGLVSAQELKKALAGAEQSFDEEAWTEVLKEANFDLASGVLATQMNIQSLYQTVRRQQSSR